MSELFPEGAEKGNIEEHTESSIDQPLAARMRPADITEIVGQKTHTSRR